MAAVEVWLIILQLLLQITAVVQIKTATDKVLPAKADKVYIAAAAAENMAAVVA